MRPIIAAATAALALGAADAGATVLYKLVDSYGHITYTDAPPRAFPGTVTRIDVDSSANNIAPAQIPEILVAAPTSPVVAQPRRAGASADERLRFARARVDAARSALADAQSNSTPEDWYYFGPNNPVGMRRAPRPEYSERLQRLEGDVLAAESALRDLER
jgi:hypothetical protein